MAGVRSKRQPNGKHRAWFTDMTGRQRFFTGTKNRDQTCRMAEKLEDEHRQIRLGYEWAGCPEKFAHVSPSKPHCYDADLQAEALAWFDRWLKG